MTVDATTLLDTLDDPVFAFDGTGALVGYNRAAVEATGYDGETLSNASATDLFEGPDLDRLVDPAADPAGDGGAPLSATLRTADGEGRPYELDPAGRVDADAGEAVVVVGRETEADATTGGTGLRPLERMGDAVFAVDDRWRVTFVNEHAEPILEAAVAGDLDVDALVGRNLWEAIPAAVDTVFHEKYHEAMETQEEVTFEEYYEPLDTWFEVRAYPSPTGLSVYFQDVTRRRRQREALETRDRVLREVYDIVSDRHRPFEAQVRDLLALGRAELDAEYGTLSRIAGGDYVLEVVDPDDRGDDEREADGGQETDDGFAAGDVVPLSATYCEVAAGSERTLVLGDVARDAPGETDRAAYADWGVECYIGTPVYVDDEVYGTFCFYDTEPRAGEFSEWERTLVDLMARWVSAELSRQRATERLRRQNEKLERFAHAVSHDLGEPLRTVTSYLELLERGHADALDEKGLELLGFAVDGAERMKDMIDGLLEYSRIDTRGAALEPTPLDAVLDEARANLRAAIEESDATVAAGDLPTVLGDRRQLVQLFQNLLANSIKYAGEDPPRVRVRADRDGQHWRIAVADEGVGMDPDQADRAFDIFERLDPGDVEGTGMGLAACEGIVDRHGGEIGIETAPGEGTTVWFTLRGAGDGDG